MRASQLYAARIKETVEIDSLALVHAHSVRVRNDLQFLVAQGAETTGHRGSGRF